MSALRRAYLYVVCLVSLEAVTWAVVTLVRRLMLWGEAERVTLQLAVIIVALPFFLVHWRWAEHDARRAAEERASALRHAYLYGLTALLLVPFLANANDLLRLVIGRLLGEALTGPGMSVGSPPREEAVRAVVAVVVLGLVAAYQARVLRADRAAVGEQGASAIVRRLFVLGFSALGMALVLVSADQILRVGLRGLTAADSIVIGSRALIAAHLSALIVGLSTWMGAWQWAERLFRSPDPAERTSALRLLYLYAFVFVGVIGCVTGAGLILAGVLRRVLGLPAAGDLAVPLAAMAVLGASWAFHHRVLTTAAPVAAVPSGGPADRPEGAAVQRLYLYLVAAVGLGAFLLGVAGVLQTAVRAASSAKVAWIAAPDVALGATGVLLKERLARFVALLACGAPVWLAGWRRAQAAAEEDTAAGERERASVVRRFYLYGYLAVATLVALAGSVYVVYRLLDRLIGRAGQADLGTQIAESLAYTAIGVVVWIYHGQALRADGRRTATSRAGRLAVLRTIVLDTGPDDPGRAIAEALHRSLPDLPLERVPLYAPSGAPADGEPAEGVPAEGWPAEGVPAQREPADAQPLALRLARALSGADMVVAAWPPPDATHAAALAVALPQTAARKVMVPAPAPGWSWAGIEDRSAAELAQSVVQAIRQQVEHGAAGWRPLGAWHSVGVAAAAVVLAVVLLAFVGPVLGYLVGG